MASGSRETLGPSRLGGEVMIALIANKRDAQLRWFVGEKMYRLGFVGGVPSFYGDPSNREVAVVRRALHAFAVATEGVMQIDPGSGSAPLSIDGLGEVLIAIVHGLSPDAVAQMVEVRGDHVYRRGSRFEAVAKAIRAGRGPQLEPPSEATRVRDLAAGASLEKQRAWIAQIVLQGLERVRAARVRAPSEAAKQSVPVEAAVGMVAPGLTDSPSPSPQTDDSDEVSALLELPLPRDPDAVHAAVDLKRRLTAMVDQDHYQVLDVARDATVDEIRAAYFELAKSYHVDRFSNMDLERYRLVAEEVFRRISRASKVLGDVDERSNYDVYLERKAKGLPTDVNAILEADNLFQRARMLVNRGNGANALPMLTRAIEVNSVDPEFQSYYVYARYLSEGEPFFEEAKQRLGAIVKEHRDLGPAHDFLGRIYRAEGNLGMAAQHLQRAIEIDPKNGTAVRELRLVQMRTTKKKESGTKGGLLNRLLKR